MHTVSTLTAEPDEAVEGCRSWRAGDGHGGRDSDVVAVLELESGSSRTLLGLEDVEQVLVVLSGEVVMGDSGGRQRIPAKSLAFVPRGVECRIMATEPTRLLHIASTAAIAGSFPSESGADVVMLSMDETDGVATSNPAMGMFLIATRPLITSDTVDARAVLVGQSQFGSSEGSHELHRHDLGEFMYVLCGSASALSEDGETELRAGDLVFIPPGEWHGLRASHGGEPFGHLFGYLGAGSFPEVGYALKG